MSMANEIPRTDLPSQESTDTVPTQKVALKLFPCYSILQGRCTCGRHDCDTAGKHPYNRGWQQIATDDLEKIESWRSNPRINLAVATGKTSGIFVLDVDPKNDGYFSRWARERTRPTP